MHAFSLATLAAKHTERKLAGLIASIASLVAVGVLVWSANFATQEEIDTLTDQPIQSIDRSTARAPIDTYTTVISKKTAASSAPTPTKSQPASKKQYIVIGRGHFYVQIGAFQQQKRARLMFEKMKHQYKRAKIIAKGDIHAVWVGPVATRSEALRLQKRLQRLDHLNGFVTTLH